MLNQAVSPTLSISLTISMSLSLIYLYASSIFGAYKLKIGLGLILCLNSGSKVWSSKVKEVVPTKGTL
ncbi:hypothetical protein GCM10008934_02080 [Virgibacillus salarius]